LSGKRRRVAIVVMFVAIFVFLSLPMSVSRSVKEVVTGFFSPVLSVCRSITDKLGDIWEVTFHGDNIVRENLRNERELLKLRLELAQAREKVEQMKSLHGQLRRAAGRGFEVIPARVNGRDPDSWYQTLLIDRGRRDGLRRGMAVAHGENFVGRVIEVGGRWSRVRLVLDVESAIPAVTVGGEVPGMVIGSGPGELKMTLIKHNDRVKVNDVVVTTHLDPVFPEEAPLPQGLVIGKMVSVFQEEEGLYQSAILESEVPFRHLSQLLVVVPK
jgi:rod shape-determining protein MreC